MIFNYKDWWSWVFYILLIPAIVYIIKASSTLEKWKYGYFSIDLIPPVIIIFMLFVINTEIRLRRLEVKK